MIESSKNDSILLADMASEWSCIINMLYLNYAFDLFLFTGYNYFYFYWIHFGSI